MDKEALKICNRCGESKPLASFHKGCYTCKLCRKIILSKKKLPFKKCFCGCGKLFRPAKTTTLYIHGHYQKGRRVTKKKRAHLRKMLKGRAREGEFGKGNSKHHAAKQFVLKSPENKKFQVSNLQAWCEENEHLFEDKYPQSKTALWLRASVGLSSRKAWGGWKLS